MLRHIVLVSAIAFPFFLSAQILRFELSILPEKHIPGSEIYLAGSFNGWQPQQDSFQFRADSSGLYRLEITLPPGRYEYKLTRGGWDKVECRKDGGSRANRIIELQRDTTVALQVDQWYDFTTTKPRVSTAGKNVQIADSFFLIPQLNRFRTIRVYLPQDYRNSGKRYPVLYMHDGQNVFDDATSFSGEWGLDEYFDSTRLRACIVVAVDHGGEKRLNEYSPFDYELNGRHQQGEGKEYAAFIVRTLKKKIDKSFRTRRGRKNTFIAGSSMGGLISLYAALAYPNTYGGAGILSPSLWICRDSMLRFIQDNGRRAKSKFYFYCGKQEGNSMQQGLLQAFSTLVSVSGTKEKLVIRENRFHNEQSWKKELPDFFTWLLQR